MLAVIFPLLLLAIVWFFVANPEKFPPFSNSGQLFLRKKDAEKIAKMTRKQKQVFVAVFLFPFVLFILIASYLIFSQP